MKPTTTNSNPIDKFVSLIYTGIEAWSEAGKIVVSESKKDESFIDRVITKHPEISYETMLMFKRIGSMQLHPRLLISDCPGYVALRRMPYEIQEKHLTAPVELLIQSNGKADTLLVDVRNLTKKQASQVFDGSSIRSTAAQRAWMEDDMAKRVVSRADEPYRIIKDKLIVMQPCQFNQRQLAHILSQIA